MVANITPSRTTLSKPYYYNSPHLDVPELQEERRPAILKNFITHTTSQHHFSISPSLNPREIILIEFKVQMKWVFLFPNLKEQQKSGRLPFTVS